MKRTSRNRSQNVLRVIGVACGALLFLVVVLFRAPLAGLLWHVLTPVVAHNPLVTLSIQVTSRATLAAENDTLRATLASTTAALADRDLLYRENLQLKSLMGRDVSARSVLAGVSVRPPMMPYDTLLIDAGARQGVTVGDYVSAGGNALIGSVDQVYPSSARVALFSAPAEVYQALLTETSAHPAIPLTVEGQGGGSMMAEVPAQTTVAVGDTIVFPGIADGLIALVSHVTATAGSSFETLYLQLPANPLQLRFVEVLTH